MDELERLREVALTAAAYRKVEREWGLFQAKRMADPALPPDPDTARRLCNATLTFAAELDDALARLAELNTPD